MNLIAAQLATAISDAAIKTADATIALGILATGAVKVAPASATVETAASGTVYYRFAAGDVDTAGKFAASFIVTDSGRTDHFPVAQEGCIVLIDSDTQTAEEAYREAVG